jgi:ATP-dependent DNA helicase RecG
MGNEQKVYDFVKKELAAGHQAYFVYPRIETDTDTADTADTAAPPPPPPSLTSTKNTSLCVCKTAEEMYPVLSKQFAGYPVALVHSRVDEEAQHQVLADFRAGTVKVIVATTVVEVGVDNPNATCMVIEHAERFGLAALHQLRGRVGRGALASYCFLVYGADIKEAGVARLKVLHDSTDGFLIAEEDLKLRGAGEITGVRQSGYLTLGIADPLKDSDILEMAREDLLGK